MTMYSLYHVSDAVPTFGMNYSDWFERVSVAMIIPVLVSSRSVHWLYDRQTEFCYDRVVYRGRG